MHICVCAWFLVFVHVRVHFWSHMSVCLIMCRWSSLFVRRMCASVLDMLRACVLCAHYYERCCVHVCECVCITVLLITHLFDNQSCRGQHLPYNSCPIVNAIGKNDIFPASILPSCRSQGRLAHNRSNLRAAVARISSMCTLVCVLLCASTLLSSALGLYAATM